MQTETAATEGITPLPTIDPAVITKADALLKALLAGALNEIVVSGRGKRARVGCAAKMGMVALVASKSEYTAAEAERLGVALLAVSTLSNGARHYD